MYIRHLLICFIVGVSLIVSSSADFSVSRCSSNSKILSVSMNSSNSSILSVSSYFSDSKILSVSERRSNSWGTSVRAGIKFPALLLLIKIVSRFFNVSNCAIW